MGKTHTDHTQIARHVVLHGGNVLNRYATHVHLAY